MSLNSINSNFSLFIQLKFYFIQLIKTLMYLFKSICARFIPSNIHFIHLIQTRHVIFTSVTVSRIVIDEIRVLQILTRSSWNSSTVWVRISPRAYCFSWSCARSPFCSRHFGCVRVQSFMLDSARSHVSPTLPTRIVGHFPAHGLFTESTSFNTLFLSFMYCATNDEQ